MNGLLKQTLAGLRVLIVLTVLLGVLYPLGVWLVSRIPGLESNAEGSIITQNNQPVGSSLIGVDLQGDQWFHSRPSAGSPSASGASNKGPANPDLLDAIAKRRAAVAALEGVQPSQVPLDAVTASASGVDPAISVDYANLQVARVARANGLPEAKVRELVAANTAGVLPGVNVLKLNLAVRDAAGGAR
ncbi:potassium-transporting ATPase subunit C [Amycolatopsis sp. NPDC059657]|uniref:potassium-transporting ATPase subunit C n=1 Tax=Amycolatopsis sp. NPDC059657 TaxID=3346899 RepID=UPI00366EE6A3